MMDQMKYIELEKRVQALELALAAIQRKDIVPEGTTPLTTLAAEMGFSTSKAEELARKCGVMIVKQGHGHIVHEVKFVLVKLSRTEPPRFSWRVFSPGTQAARSLFTREA